MVVDSDFERAELVLFEKRVEFDLIAMLSMKSATVEWHELFAQPLVTSLMWYLAWSAVHSTLVLIRLQLVEAFQHLFSRWLAEFPVIVRQLPNR